jgi:hypothetical protein
MENDYYENLMGPKKYCYKREYHCKGDCYPEN